MHGPVPHLSPSVQSWVSALDTVNFLAKSTEKVLQPAGAARKSHSVVEAPPGYEEG